MIAHSLRISPKDLQDSLWDVGVNSCNAYEETATSKTATSLGFDERRAPLQTFLEVTYTFTHTDSAPFEK